MILIYLCYKYFVFHVLIANIPLTSVAEIAADEFRFADRRLLCGEFAEELTGRPSISSR